MATGGVSVIVRARDEELSLERCLSLIGAQSFERPVQLVLVDGGSADGTREVARRHGATVLEAERDPYSFGAALNQGAQAADGEILVALSAHAFPRDSGWLARLCAAFADPAVACACGDAYGPDGELSPGAAVARTSALAERRPEWGYSNAAGGFRAALWRQRALPARPAGVRGQGMGAVLASARLLRVWSTRRC